MASISKREDLVVIELSTLEKAEALHGDIEVPRSAIEGIEVVEDAIHEIHGLRPEGLKITGTYLPGRLAMGTYLDGLHHKPVFAAIHHDTKRGVRILLKDWKYSAIIVGCPDPESVRTELLGR
jgi:hypothetical protein